MDVLAPVEDRFDNPKVVSFAQQHWHYSFYISAVYVVTVFSLQRFMQDRERYNLRVPLFMWSLTLALFSLMGSVSAGIPQVSHFLTFGWESSVCGDVLIEGRPGLWAFLFCFSKLPELVDTYFIVLRKQKLIFLHWYHHVTVFIYCWYHYSLQLRPAQWFITLNYFVHAVMYTYYAVRASGRVRPPIWVNMIVTLLQLLQMVLGVYINVFIYTKMGENSSWKCDGTVESSYFYVYWSFAMYFSYFVLFVHFFWCTYFSKLSKRGKKTVVEEEKRIVNSTADTGLHCNGHIPNGTKTPYRNGITLRHSIIMNSRH